MIDHSQTMNAGGPILLDRQPSMTSGYKPLNDRLQTANSQLGARGIPTIYDTTSAFIGGNSGLMGYFSWGSNDPAYTGALYTSNLFAPGSIADTYVSSSGRTFYPATSGQSLIADLIPQGVCGVLGYVSEPYTGYSTYADVLFDRYTRGYNMAESFYMATPELSWKSVVVGDPLMAAYATPPVVSIDVNGPLTGPNAVVSASATDPPESPQWISTWTAIP